MRNYRARLHTSTKKTHNIQTTKLIGYILCAIAFGTFAMAARWQIGDFQKYSVLAQSQYSNSEKHDTGRGTISTVDGTILAVDQPAWRVYASLSSQKSERDIFFANKDSYISTVSTILGIPKESFESKITYSFRFFLIADGVTSEKKKALEDMKIFKDSKGNEVNGLGLYYEQEEKRVYPDGSLASHILGFIGKDSEGNDLGQFGIEGFYFDDITGSSGKTLEEKDSQGNVILTAEYQPILPREGKSFELTIVPSIQKKVEKVLKKGVAEHQAKSGTVIIMNPNTGAIIAMANYPDYNPNEYWKVTDPWVYKNKAVSDVYEYGSVQKPITEAIGLESGKVKEDFICNDATGSLKLYDKTIYTWNKKPNGKLTLGGILEKSNNPCAATVALKTGHQYYYPKLQEFGFGSMIGMGMQEETTGYLAPYEVWTKLDLATTAFGQSISATPMQVISALSTIANEGKRMKPYIISKVTEGDEVITESKPQVAAQPISAKTAKLVAKFMEGVTLRGEPKTLFATRLPNYSVAGKTGTAQIPKKNSVGYYADRTNTTFVGFAPVEDAKMIMLVRLEEPKLNSFSVITAVPVWIDVFKAVADDLEISPK